MRYAATNIDLIQPDAPEPSDREFAEREAYLAGLLKSNPPNLDYIFGNEVCLPNDYPTLRDALKQRDTAKIGALLLAYFDALCDTEANVLAMDDMTGASQSTRVLLREIGADRWEWSA